MTTLTDATLNEIEARATSTDIDTMIEEAIRSWASRPDRDRMIARLVAYRRLHETALRDVVDHHHVSGSTYAEGVEEGHRCAAQAVRHALGIFVTDACGLFNRHEQCRNIGCECPHHHGGAKGRSSTPESAQAINGDGSPSANPTDADRKTARKLVGTIIRIGPGLGMETLATALAAARADVCPP